MDATENARTLSRVRVMAESLGFVLDEDLQELAQVKATTTDAWRRRGKGPEYVLIGCRYMYPKEAVSRFLNSRVRQQSRIVGGGML